GERTDADHRRDCAGLGARQSEGPLEVRKSPDADAREEDLCDADAERRALPALQREDLPPDLPACNREHGMGDRLDLMGAQRVALELGECVAEGDVLQAAPPLAPSADEKQF